MTAAGISGRPSQSHVSSDWWEVCIFRPQLRPGLSLSLSSDGPAGKFSTYTCEWLAYIKIHHRKTAPEQSSERQNMQVPLLQTEKTCCCKCLENFKWCFAVVMIRSGVLNNIAATISPLLNARLNICVFCFTSCLTLLLLKTKTTFPTSHEFPRYDECTN